MLTLVARKQAGYLIMLMLCIFAFVYTQSAHALSPTVVDDMIGKFQSSSTAWRGPLLSIATSLFWLLATIQFAWSMIGLAFRTTDFNTWISTIVTQIMFIGFMYWLLLNAATFAEAIVNSFRQAAGQASGYSFFTPSDFFIQAWALVKNIYDQTSLLEPANSLGLIIAGIIIMICFALICAFLVLALVEMYIVISASVLLMGFGGTQWTKDYAIRALQYAVSVGAKLFILQLIAGLGLELMNSWMSNTDPKSFEDILGIIGCSVILLALTKVIPEIVQGIINGTSIASGGALTSAVAAVSGAAAGAAVATAGQSSAVSSSFKLASEQLKSSNADGGSPTVGGQRGSMLGLISQAGKNYAGGLASDLGGRLTGQTSSKQTTGTSLGGRMASTMNTQRDNLKARREASQPKENPTSKNNDGNNDNTIS